MGFFKEFKEDFSEAMNELVPGDDAEETTEESMVNTLDEEIDVDSELSKLDGLLEQVSKKVDNNEKIAVPERIVPETVAIKEVVEETKEEPKEEKKEEIKEEEMEVKEISNTNSNEMVANMMNPINPINTPNEMPKMSSVPASDENAVITKGMTIKGDLDSTGSIEVQGTINGNISCSGKLVITGTINGNSTSSEFFADSAKVEGEVSTTGTAKIGVGSVVIGNITATSAVIAGAVKGDIDVQGPVVVDTSAVVMGNIKSRSVQINNGAVIEGFCSQSYAEVDVEGVFA